MPPVVALLNYIRSGKLWQIFSQTGIFAGFSLHIINLAVRISEAAMKEVGDIIFHNFGAQRKGVNRLFIVKSLPKKNVGSQCHLQLHY